MSKEFLKSIKYKFIDHAYPDFGFKDPLNFELRESNGD